MQRPTALQAFAQIGHCMRQVLQSCYSGEDMLEEARVQAIVGSQKFSLISLCNVVKFSCALAG